MEQDELDEILGVTRCVRCGHRLDGEIECPFCAALPAGSRKEPVPKWMYITACFLTSPFSLYFILRSRRLGTAEKVFASSGGILWLGLYLFRVFG
jgi:hypothetical protein